MYEPLDQRELVETHNYILCRAISPASSCHQELQVRWKWVETGLYPEGLTGLYSQKYYWSQYLSSESLILISNLSKSRGGDEILFHKKFDCSFFPEDDWTFKEDIFSTVVLSVADICWPDWDISLVKQFHLEEISSSVSMHWGPVWCLLCTLAPAMSNKEILCYAPCSLCTLKLFFTV